MLDAFHPFDLSLFTLINQKWRNAFFDDFMPTLSQDPLFWGLIAGTGIAYFTIKGRKGLKHMWLPLLVLGLSVGTADTAANVVKNTITRARPQHSLPGVYFESGGSWMQTSTDFTGKRSKSNSFYSGHATNSMALAVTMAAIVPQTAPLVFLLPLGVGYSRVYLGKHYPSDVFFGWFMGWIIGKGFKNLYRHARRRLELSGVVFPTMLG